MILPAEGPKLRPQYRCYVRTMKLESPDLWYAAGLTYCGFKLPAVSWKFVLAGLSCIIRPFSAAICHSSFAAESKSGDGDTQFKPSGIDIEVSPGRLASHAYAESSSN